MPSRCARSGQRGFSAWCARPGQGRNSSGPYPPGRTRSAENISHDCTKTGSCSQPSHCQTSLRKSEISSLSLWYTVIRSILGASSQNAQAIACICKEQEERNTKCPAFGITFSSGFLGRVSASAAAFCHQESSSSLSPVKISRGAVSVFSESGENIRLTGAISTQALMRGST